MRFHVDNHNKKEIFEGIVNKTIPANIVHENKDFMAFLDIFPISKGHTIVISKQYSTDDIFDLPIEVYSEMLLFAKQVSKMLYNAILSKKISMSVIGLEINYAHIHLIPINELSDVNFGNPKIKAEDSDLKSILEDIKFKNSRA